jgi:hypothetical protein
VDDGVVAMKENGRMVCGKLGKKFEKGFEKSR